MSEMLTTYLSSTPDPLVLVDGLTPGFADSVSVPAGVPVARVVPGWSCPRNPVTKTIVLVLPDPGALRRLLPLLSGVPSVRMIGLYFREADEPVAMVPRPEWPRVKQLNCRTSKQGEAMTVMQVASTLAAGSVYAELARGVGVAAWRGEGALVVGLLGDQPGTLPIGDASALSADDLEALVGDDVEVPPDVLLTAATAAPGENAVLGRAPVSVGSTTAPVDEIVVNPVGYLSDVTGPVATLQRLGATWRIKTPESEVLVDAPIGLGDPHVRRLRDLRGVQVDWPAAEAPGLTLLVAGLAMAGVPVTSGPVPTWAAPGLGGLADVVAADVDLDSMLTRDEHSVRLRRAAFAEHSTFAWRRRLAATAGVRGPEHPTVSILLATKRPHQLEHALAQVARQRGADIELVLATHGITADPALVRKVVGDLPVVQLERPESTPFGDVLTAAAQAASGDLLLKLDDDDWYGPDAISDLLMARRYSGAALVGMPAEFTYLQQVDTTIRRNDRTEFYARFVAGGTIMIERGLLQSVGWFRSVRKYVDKQLLQAVEATSAPIYRTHGLGYVMRRTGEGHTWEPGLDFFLDEERVGTRYDGFSPSALLEA